MRHLKWLGGFALTALLLYRPQAAAAGAQAAMAHWYATVAPAVFPFMALLPLLTCADAIRAYEALAGRAMGALFRLPGAAAPAMVVGMVAGTPAGALAARSVAAGGGMDRGQLWRVAVAMAGFSPAFLVGGIGAGMLGSAALGWRLALAQLATQLTLALLLRRSWRDRHEAVPDAGTIREASPVRSAALAALTICGYMALFGALNGAIGACLGENAADALLCLLDVPSGARLVATLPLTVEARLILLSAMCGFGGACAIAQSLAALGGCGPGLPEYVGLRALAAGVSAGHMALQLRLAGTGVPRLVEAALSRPLAAAGLCASALAIPVLFKLKKSIS